MDTALVAVSAAYLVLSARKNRKKRRFWMKDYLKKRNNALLEDLEINNDILFKNFTRMSKTTFYKLLTIVEPKITKQNTHYRDAIPAKIKLVITLRFLATGDSFMSLMYLFKVSKQTISYMLPEILRAIIEGLKDYVMIPSTEQQWKQLAENLDRRWNFPHCIGALDGKHIVILRPENTVGEFYNYKGTNSIVLLAVFDANYSFIYVNGGCQGRISDGGVFKNTSFYRSLENNELHLPTPEPLPGRSMPVPYVLVADDAFPLTSYCMKPYKTDLNVGSTKRVFNYRLSRARRIVENAFGLLASVFRIFHKPIELKLEKTIVDVVLCCVYLHNFLRMQPDSTAFYSTVGCFDTEDASTGINIPGSWRRVTEGDTGYRNFRSVPRRPTRTATEVQDELKDYFMSDLSRVPWQNQYS